MEFARTSLSTEPRTEAATPDAPELDLGRWEMASVGECQAEVMGAADLAACSIFAQ